MSTNPTHQLHEQGAPILLLAQLHREMKPLPSASFRIQAHCPEQLDISLHPTSGDMPALEAFEIWRAALGLGDPGMLRSGDLAWLVTHGRVSDVPVKLVGYGSPDEVTAVAAAVGVEIPASWVETAEAVPA